MVYLCGRQLEGKYSLLGRETALDKITWTADGWPMVNGLNGPSTLAKRPDLPEYKAKEEPTEFGGKPLGFFWVTPREPEENFAEIKEDGVYLLGSRTDLCEVSARNLLLQRQTAFSFEAETRFSFDGLSDGQDAGMTCYYDENTYLKFGVFKERGKLFLKVQEHVDNDTWDSFSVELPDTFVKEAGSYELVLRCNTRNLERRFSYAFAESGSEMAASDFLKFTELGTLSNVYYLCDEGIKRGKRFTGAMVGIYVYGADTRIPFRYFKMY